MGCGSSSESHAQAPVRLAPAPATAQTAAPVPSPAPVDSAAAAAASTPTPTLNNAVVDTTSPPPAPEPLTPAVVVDAALPQQQQQHQPPPAPVVDTMEAREKAAAEEAIEEARKRPTIGPFSAVNKSAPPPLSKSGWISKQGHAVKNWKKRHFELSQGVLVYFDDDKARNEKGRLPSLSNYESVLGGNTGEPLLLLLKPCSTAVAAAPGGDSPGDQPRELLLCFDDVDHLYEWKTALDAHIAFYSHATLAL